MGDQDDGQNDGETSAKRTMMGLPAATVDGGGVADDDANDGQKDTLFGVPAAVPSDDANPSADQGQSSQSPSPDGAEQQTSSDDAASTEVLSNVEDTLAEALSDADFSDADSADHVDQDAPAETFASAWGLGEQSSESTSGATQVAGASLVDAINESKQGQQGFSKSSASSGGPTGGTLMGLNPGQDDDDSTRNVDADAVQAAVEARKKAALADDRAGMSDDINDGATAAIDPEKLAGFDERMTPSNQRDTPPRGTDPGIPSARENSSASFPPGSRQPGSGQSGSGQSGSGQSGSGQSGSGQHSGDQRQATSSGTRFSIPTAATDDDTKSVDASDSAVEALSAQAIEPVDDDSSPTPAATVEGGHTNFSVSGADDQTPLSDSGAIDFDEAELEQALAETGMLSVEDDHADAGFDGKSSDIEGAGDPTDDVSPSQPRRRPDSSPAAPSILGQPEAAEPRLSGPVDEQSPAQQSPAQQAPAQQAPAQQAPAQQAPAQQAPAQQAPAQQAPAQQAPAQQAPAQQAPASQQQAEHQPTRQSPELSGSKELVSKPSGGPGADADTAAKLLRGVRGLFGILGGVFAAAAVIAALVFSATTVAAVCAIGAVLLLACAVVFPHLIKLIS